MNESILLSHSKDLFEVQYFDHDRAEYPKGELGSFFFPLYESASNIPEALAFGRIAGAQTAALTPWV